MKDLPGERSSKEQAKPSKGRPNKGLLYQEIGLPRERLTKGKA
jgi:hypothetical protein